MIEWIDTSGPPLCGALEIARQWKGGEASSIGQEHTDYDRACAVADYVGKLTCGTGEVLVLGDEPLRSAFFVTNQTLAIARWWSCESAERAVTALLELPSRLPAIEESVRFQTAATSLIMFDAARHGEEHGDHRLTAIAAGSYLVTSERYELPEVFRFLIHRFVRQ